MALRICILGSGSSGNSTYVSSGATSILIDAGLSAREIQKRLEQVGVALSSICAICVSHEHTDHTAGLRVLQQRHGIELYANAGTIEGLSQDEDLKGLKWKVFETGSGFAVGDLSVEPFSVPHDAYEPVGFIVSDGAARVGVVTDMGVPTSLIRERLRRCHALVVEANHDERMLKEADRPWHLKQRIMGRQGHLSNERAAAMLADVATPELHTVFLAHLSAECNRPDLARKTAHDMLLKHGHAHVNIQVACQDTVSEMWSYAAAG